jgi:hypothetical protein
VCGRLNRVTLLVGAQSLGEQRLFETLSRCVVGKIRTESSELVPAVFLRMSEFGNNNTTEEQPR